MIVTAVLLLPVLVLFITRKCKYRGKISNTYRAPHLTNVHTLCLLSGKGSKVTEDVSLQTNEAYCTVTTGVPMKRNEA